MKKLIFCTLIFLSSFCKAQYGDNEKGHLLMLAIFTRIEMTSIDEKAFLSFGPKIPISEKDYISLRGHFNWWDLPGKKFVVIPEFDYIRTIATFEDGNPVISNLYAGVGITPYAVSPKFGVAFYHLFTAEVGNNFEFNEYKHFSTKGFRFSIGLNFTL